MMKKEILEKVLDAQEAVTAAEVSLQQIVAEMDHSPRAEKITITEIVRDAFSRLAVAKADLSKLKKLLDKEDE